MTSLRILLFGGSGMIGSELRRALAGRGEVRAPASADCDIADPEAITAAFKAFQPQIVVNAAAHTAVDMTEAEAERAFSLNGMAPAHIAVEAARRDALFVHYSTDYVFDGAKTSAYEEGDSPNPLNTYGRSKLHGEEKVRAAGGPHLILRTSWVYGRASRSFPKTVLDRALAGEPLKVVADQSGAPTSAVLIADITGRCIDHFCVDTQPRWNLSGLYHLAAAGSTTWHGVARRVVETAQGAGMEVRTAADAVEAVSSTDRSDAARRPANSILSCERLQAAFNLTLPDWKRGIDQFVRHFAGIDLMRPR